MHPSFHEYSVSSPEPVGNVIGVDQLFREHASYVTAFLRRIGTDAGSVDDVVQEVFLTAHKRGGYRVGAASVRTWLGAIALRVAANARRSVRRRRETPDDGAFEGLADLVTPEAVTEQREELAQVERCLQSMSEAQRDAFLRFSLGGDSCADIAAAVGIPTGTVYSRLHAARHGLAEVLEALAAA